MSPSMNYIERLRYALSTLALRGRAHVTLAEIREQFRVDSQARETPLLGSRWEHFLDRAISKETEVGNLDRVDGQEDTYRITLDGLRSLPQSVHMLNADINLVVDRSLEALRSVATALKWNDMPSEESNLSEKLQMLTTLVTAISPMMIDVINDDLEARKALDAIKSCVESAPNTTWDESVCHPVVLSVMRRVDDTVRCQFEYEQHKERFAEHSLERAMLIWRLNNALISNQGALPGEQHFVHT